MEKSVTNLETDYLVVGAGAMGMSFLEELITNSSKLEAIILDTRPAPGGHWNDAYSFVRLHQPALTYGVNSRTLGEGGPDMASKALILQHFELALKDLIATGRVKFFPKCKYIGEGKFVSLLDEDVEYHVKIRSKFVDATCTTTHVPATRKPNFEVAEGVNFVPINGLSGVTSPWLKYLIIGGGKTGIDAVLYLLDNSVNPDKIQWIIPNDSWFWNRNATRFDDGNFHKFVYKLIDPMLDEKADTVEKVILNMEENGGFLRLDKNILPTRYRAGSVSVDEIEKMQRIKGIIRKGRIASIKPGKLIFNSGEEMDIDTNTLCVDCSVNGTLFPPAKKVFDGNTINIQFIRMPPPGLSANIIAALELKYPNEEEKKNEVCVVLKAPQMPEDLILNFYTDGRTNEAEMKLLGFNWERKRRASGLHHVKLLDLLKMIFLMMKRKDRLKKKWEMLLVEREEKDVKEVK